MSREVVREDGERFKGEPHGWIQWKGTDVCIDLYCACGRHLHFDGDFLYSFKCPGCGQIWELGMNVALYPVDEAPWPKEIEEEEGEEPSYWKKKG